MYVITVEFLVKENFLDQFLSAMYEQAKNSLSLETGCHHFDVAISDNNPRLIFLYELYTDKTAFNAHLASDHFTTFNTAVTDWVEQKKVASWVMQD